MIGRFLKYGACAACLALGTTAGYAEDSGCRLDSVGWMRLGIGARAQALGGAFTARADDGTAPYWNPAFIESFGPYETEFAFMGLPMTLGRRASYFSYIQKLDRNLGSIAAGWHYYRIGGIENRDEAGAHLGDLEDLSNTFALSYGRALDADWRVGATLNYYWRQLAGAEGKGVGLDVAAAYRPKGTWLRWEFGAALKQLSPGLLWTTGRKEAVMPALRLGAAYHIIYDQLIAAADLELTWRQKALPHAGVEWWVWEPLAVRAGLDNLGLYVGAGYRAGPYQFDYSYSVLLEGLSDEHRFTLMYKL